MTRCQRSTSIPLPATAANVNSDRAEKTETLETLADANAVPADETGMLQQRKTKNNWAPITMKTGYISRPALPRGTAVNGEVAVAFSGPIASPPS